MKLDLAVEGMQGPPMDGGLNWTQTRPCPWQGLWFAKIFGDVYLMRLHLFENDPVVQEPEAYALLDGRKLGKLFEGLNWGEVTELVKEVDKAIEFNTDVWWHGPIELPDGVSEGGLAQR